MTLEIPTQLESALQNKAQQQGVSPESCALSVLERETKASSFPDERWAKFFGLVAQLPHDPNAPPVSEEQAQLWLVAPSVKTR